MNQSVPSFSCSACGARFALNREVAERKIACPCGNVFLAPGLPEYLLESEPYDLDSSAATAAPAAFEAYPRRRPRVAAADASDAESSVARDIAAPIVLLSLGVAIRFCEIPFDRSFSGARVGAAAAIVIFQIILTVTLMLAGVLIAAKVLGVHFGSVGTAILKLCGLAVFAWACGALIVLICRYNTWGFVVAIHVTFLICFCGFWTLFSMEVQEALVTTAICALLQDGAALILFMDK
jgi:hypothetical protein